MIEVRFTHNLDQYIKKLEKDLDNLDSFYRNEAAKVMKQTFAEVFRNEGASRSTSKWRELAPVTRRSRSRRPGGKILWDTGRLRDSYVHNPVLDIRNNVMTIGSNVHYARYHELGTSRIPARPVLGYAAKIGAPKLQRQLRKHLREVL